MIRIAARNPGAAWTMLLGILALAAALRAQTTAPTHESLELQRNLLAHGTEQQLWCADVIPPPPGTIEALPPGQQSSRTIIRFRTFGDPQWRVIAEIGAPVICMENRESELLVVLADGQWQIVSTDGMVRSGSALSQPVRMLAIAGGDNQDIWAVGAAAPGHRLDENPPAAATTDAASTSATAPSTASAASTRPSAIASSQSSRSSAASRRSFPPHDVALFHQVQGTWKELAILPDHLRAADIVSASLDVIDHRVMLAIATQHDGVHVYSHTGAGWSDGHEVAPFSPGQRMKLTDFEDRPIVWISDARGPGKIYISAGGAKWGDGIALTPPANLDKFDRTVLVAALGRLRLLESDGKNRLAEQNYNLDGSLSGPATEAPTAPVPLDTRVAEAIQLIIMAVLLVWIIGAMRQRPAVQEALQRIDRTALAPLGRRLAGGIIDALPVIIAFIISAEMAQSATQPLASQLTIGSPEIAISALGVAVYLLHTTVVELIFARSLGKFLTGTRVVSIAGARPSPSAILIRNLLRLVDVFMVFPPIFVVFSPLRQRVGDMAAGTIVISNNALPVPRPSDEAAK